MRDVEKALIDIADIRSQIAATTTFRGFGPHALGLTGILALGCALWQHWSGVDAVADPLGFFLTWIVVAVVCVSLVGAEVIVRSRRHHGGMADQMIHQAIQQFLPAGAAGAALAAILSRFAPEAVWLLPGVWALFVSLGLFAAVPSLPRGAILAGGWYFVSGCVVLMLAAPEGAISPFMMGLPFAVGQFLLAAIVHRASGDEDAA